MRSSSRDPTKTNCSLDRMCHILLFMDSSSRNSVGALAGSWRTNSPLGLKLNFELMKKIRQKMVQFKVYSIDTDFYETEEN